MISLSNKHIHGILGDRDIKECIKIYPFNDDNINPASYDCTLSNHFLKLKDDIKTIDPFNKDSYGYRKITLNKYVMSPNEFLLGVTNEIIDLKNIRLKNANGNNIFVVGEVSGKSSLGRLGLEIHMTAGFIDPGFVGSITLEIKNNSNHEFLLTKGMKICQIKFTTTSHVDTLYCDKIDSKYINEKSVIGSKYYLNKKIVE